MKEIVGNLLDFERGIAVHGCNAQGVMRSGVAKEVKARFPEAFEAYRRHWEASGGFPELGSVAWAEVGDGKWIANAVTQEFYGRDGKAYASLEAIEKSLAEVARFAKERSLPVRIPKIGCGLGGLDWAEVGPAAESALAGVEAAVFVWAEPAEG